MDMKMGGAYQMREQHEEIKKREGAKHPVTGEKLGLGEFDRSIEQILDNKRECDLFLNLFLNRKNPTVTEAIIKKRADRDTLSIEDAALTESEEKFLEDSREEYNHCRADAARIRELLTGERVVMMTRADKDLKELTGQLGPEGAASFLSDQIEELALTYPVEFKKIADAMKATADIQGGKEAEKVEENIKRLRAKYGVTEEEYNVATKDGTTYESRQNLNTVAQAQFTGWRKALDFATFGIASKWRGGKLYATLEERTRLLEECDEHSKVILKTLRSMARTPEIRLAYQDRTFKGAQGEATVYNVTSIKDYKRVRDHSKEDARKDRFKKKLDALARSAHKKDWDKITDAQRTDLKDNKVDGLKDTFLDEEEKYNKQQRGRGIIAALIALLFPSRSDMRTQIDSVL